MRVLPFHRHGGAREETLEGFPKLLAHAAVDEEVERVTEEDEEVGEERECLEGVVVQNVDGESVGDDHDDEEDPQRELHQQEQPHHCH